MKPYTYICILLAATLSITSSMSNASQWQNNSVQPLAIMDAKGKQPITMLNYCSIPHLAANSGFIKGYFNFYEQDENTARNKLIPKLLATLQNSQTDEPISLNEAAQRIVALEQLIKHYAKKDIPNLTKLIASKNNDEISKLLQTANFLTLPEKFMGHLALPLTKAWGPNLQAYTKKTAFEEQIKIAAQLLGGTAEVHQISRPIKASEHLTLQGHTGQVNSATFSPDGTTIVTASSDGKAKIWDAQTGKLLHTLKGHTRRVNSATFSPDGTTIVTASDDDTAKIWDAQTGQLLETLEGHTACINSATFSADGNKIITASDDETAKIWNVQTGQCLHTLEGHNSWILSATFNPDSTKVVTTSLNKIAKMWDVEMGKHILTLDDLVLSATFSPDGTKIVTISFDNTAKIWEAKTGKLLNTLKGHTGWINSATFSPNGTTIVTASFDNTAKIWDAKTGELLKTLNGHTGRVRKTTFSPNNKLIVTEVDDHIAKIWKLKYPKVTAAEYLLYHTFRYSGLQELQLQEGAYLAKIIEKLNSRFPKDQPAIPI